MQGLTDDVLHEGGEGAESGIHSVEEASQDHDAGGGGYHAVLGGHGHRSPVAQTRSIPGHQPRNCRAHFDLPITFDYMLTQI